MPEPALHLAVFLSLSGQGGVERMVLNLCAGFAAAGCRVDLLLVAGGRATPPPLPPGVNLVPLPARHTAASLFSLVAYLRRARPQALLAAKERANRVALAARRLAGVRTRVVVRVGTTVSAALAGRSRLRLAMWHWPMRFFYPRADGIVAVSRGVAADLSRITGLPAGRFTVIPNPVITPRMLALAELPVDHPWLGPGAPPVILGCGRLTRQKGFPHLLQAFARLRRDIDCRLIILGEGRERPALLNLAAQLGVAATVDLPGYVANPYAYMRRASLFVLSSLWEGSPNVLTEALALGVPVVATDCPSGPREILADGRLGALVPVGRAELLADAMADALHHPPDPAGLRLATAEYHLETSARRYLALLAGEGRCKEAPGHDA
jgi:glycosyltransferase involved in cell wall biosynthesis